MEPTLNRVFVKPATPETRLRMPVGGYLPPEGREVTLDSFWMRRIADGDVVATPVVPVVPLEPLAEKAAKKLI